MNTGMFFTMAAIVAAVLFLRNGVTSTSVYVVLGAIALLSIPWYFGTRDRRRPPSSLEVVVATAWVWLRRILAFGLGSAMLVGAVVYAVLGPSPPLERFVTAGGLVLVSVFILYVGIFGQGPRRNAWRDDVALHKQNKARYRWWF